MWKRPAGCMEVLCYATGGMADDVGSSSDRLPRNSKSSHVASACASDVGVAIDMDRVHVDFPTSARLRGMQLMHGGTDTMAYKQLM
jgi:hypothetical protein